MLKPQTKNTMLKSQSKRSYTTSTIAANSKDTFFKEKHQFYDYSKTIVCSETVDSPRFLNNVYMSIFHYIFESQDNAAASV